MFNCTQYTAPFEVRRAGVRLAKELWERGLDETSPVPDHPLIPTGVVQRPDWAILGKVNLFTMIRFVFFQNLKKLTFLKFQSKYVLRTSVLLKKSNASVR